MFCFKAKCLADVIFSRKKGCIKIVLIQPLVCIEWLFVILFAKFAGKVEANIREILLRHHQNVSTIGKINITSG